MLVFNVTVVGIGKGTKKLSEFLYCVKVQSATARGFQRGFE
jgi:hypothetical protein